MQHWANKARFLTNFKSKNFVIFNDTNLNHGIVIFVFFFAEAYLNHKKVELCELQEHVIFYEITLYRIMIRLKKLKWCNKSWNK